MKKQKFYIATAVYIIAAVAFFVIPPTMRGVWISVPTWLLTILCAIFGDKYSRIAAIALTASAIGDVFGSIGALLPQIGGFAVAQIVYAVLFGYKATFDVRRLPLLLAPLGVAIAIIVAALPRIDGFLQTAIIGYMVVILAMCGCAIFIQARHWWLIALGAMMFVVSDSIIAWNLFVERIPHAFSLIMATYYVAQGLLGLTILYGALSDAQQE